MLCYTPNAMSTATLPLDPPSKRRLVTPEVEEAKEYLMRAIAESLAASNFTRNDAEAKFSLFLCLLWDDLAPTIRRLPEIRRSEGSDLGLEDERSARTGQRRKNRNRRREAEWLSL